MIGGSLLFVATPVAAAGIAFLLRRFTSLSAIVAALVPLALAVFALRAPLNEPQGLLGRVVVLGSGDRLGLALLFIVSSAIFVGVWRSSPDWSYYPIALLVIGALAAALIVRPPLNEIYPSFVYSALFMAIAAALSVFPLQGGEPGVTRGSLRFITLMALALPALLLADWTLGQRTQNPDAANLAQGTLFLVAIGFTLLLAIFPFHTWVPTVSREAPPLSTAFVLTALLGTALILLLDVLNETRVIGGDPRALEMLRAAGLLMACVGAALAWNQTDFGRLLGYGAIGDMGAILFAIGLASSTGLAAAFIMLIVRALSIGLLAMGMSLVRGRLKSDAFDNLHGVVRRLPWASAAIVAGGLSLAGLPPLAGFAGRWGLLQETSQFDPAAAAVLLASVVSVAVGVLRGLRAMLQPAEEGYGSPPRERPGETVLIIGALTLCVLLGVFPGILAGFVREFVAAYPLVAR